MNKIVSLVKLSFHIANAMERLHRSKERFFITFVIIYAIFSNTLKIGPRECAIGDTRQKCWIVEIQPGYLSQQPLWC